MSNRPRHEAKHAEGSFVVSFSQFAELTTERDEPEDSPEIMCLGRKWVIGIYPGGREESGDGMVGLAIGHMSDQRVSIAFSFSVRNSAGEEIVSHDEFDGYHTTLMPFDREGNAEDTWFFSDFVSRTTILDALIEGALVIEVRLRLTDPGGTPLIPSPVENPLCKSVEGSFEVSFREFAELSTERGKCKDSPAFLCLGHKWFISIYPGGEEDSGDGMVAVAIENISSQSIDFVCSFGVRNSAGREIVSHDEPNDTPIILDGLGQGYSSHIVTDFALRSALLNALIDGALVIEVRLRLVDPAGMPPRPFLIKNPICENMRKKFLDEESSDVVFEVETDGGEANKIQTTKKKAKKLTLFHAHRFIIKEGAPLLYELCKSGGRIRITDVKRNVFRHILFYLYGGELSKETLGANARELIDAADRYGAVHLKLRAEAEYVKAAISLDNAMDNLLYADAKNCALLKEAVMDFLVENKDEAIKKISFVNAPGYLMKDLLTAVSAKYGKKDASCKAAHDYSAMRVDALRRKLHEKGLDIDGSREAMIALLEKYS